MRLIDADKIVNFECKMSNGKNYVLLPVEHLHDIKTATIADSMSVIVGELRKDKTPGSWYYSWQSNLARVMMDVAGIDHDAANKAAIRFLDRLCEPTPCE